MVDIYRDLGSSSPIHDLDTQTVIQDDFILSSTTGIYGWVGSTAGTSSSVAARSNPSDANHPGQVKLNCAQAASSRASLSLAINQIEFGAGIWSHEIMVEIPTLSNATNEYSLMIGFNDSVIQTHFPNSQDRIVAYYDRTQGVNWFLSNEKGNTETAVDSGVAVKTGWTKVRLEVAPDGSESRLYLDDVLIITNTSNVPTAASGLIYGIYGNGSASADRFFHLDYVDIRYTASNQRSGD